MGILSIKNVTKRMRNKRQTTYNIVGGRSTVSQTSSSTSGGSASLLGLANLWSQLQTFASGISVSESSVIRFADSALSSRIYKYSSDTIGIDKLIVDNDLNVGGNLNITGTINSYNQDELNIGDSWLNLATETLVDIDAGIRIYGAGSSLKSTFMFDVSADSWSVDKPLTIEGIKLKNSTDRPGLLELPSIGSAWGGIQVRNDNNTTFWSYMANNFNAGIYDDDGGKWAILAGKDSYTVIYFNGYQRIATTAGGGITYGKHEADNFGTVAAAGKYSFAGDPTNYYIGNSNTITGIEGEGYYGWTFKGRGNIGLHINTSGNVGIKQTTANEALDVLGNIKTSGQFKIGTLWSIGYSGTDLVIYNSTGVKTAKLSQSGTLTVKGDLIAFGTI